MISNNRDDIQITREMLLLANDGIKKTPLMYQSNLCYNHFMIYLEFLLRKKFLIEKREQPGKRYYTTEKGHELVQVIDSVIHLMK
jgi:predicted transcriptional regulator